MIVAIGEYQDPALRRLRSPVHDAEALREVLAAPAIGGFDVQLAVGESEVRIRRRLSAFFANRGPDDTLLLHFSCHGVKDDSGELYFAMNDTELAALDATALPADFVRRQMNRSRSRRIVLLLDCCYAGAFSRGWEHRGGEGMDLEERFQGRGHAVLTASSSMEYAFEGGALTKVEGRPSVFTSALVKGLRTGAADGDGDGSISVDELYRYLHDQVQLENPDQTPLMWNLGIQGEFVIAKTPYVQVVELPDELKAAVESPYKSFRMEAVTELRLLVQSQHRGRAAAARQALEMLRAQDDSLSVRQAATEALEGEPPARPPEPSPAATPPAPPPEPTSPPAAPAPSPEAIAPPTPPPTPPPDVEVVKDDGTVSETWRRWARLLVPVAVAVVVSAVVATTVARLGGGDGPPADGRTPTTPPARMVTPGAWQPVADLGVALEAPGVAVLGDSLWIVGGLSPDRGRPSLDTVRVYDSAKRTWRDGPKLPVPLDHAAVATDGSNVYVVGGQTGTGTKQASAETYRLDGPTDSTWTHVTSAPLPQPRAAGALVWDGRRLVFAGGFTLPDRAPHADVWALEAGKWRSIGKLHRAREHLAGAADNSGRVWFIGGFDQRKRSELYGTVDIVDRNGVRPGQSTVPIRSSAAVWIEGAGMCLFGGMAAPSGSTPHLVDEVFCQHPGAGLRKWPALPSPRAGHGVAVLRNTVYVVGGFDRDAEGTSRVDALPFDTR